MTDPPVATKIHQSFDIHRYITPKVSLHRKPPDFGSELFDFSLTEIAYLHIAFDAGTVTDLHRSGASDTVDRCQSNPGMFLYRDIDTCYTSHAGFSMLVRLFKRFLKPTDVLIMSKLTLPLLVPWICTNHTQNTFAFYDFAVSANFLDRCSDFHYVLLRRSARPFGLEIRLFH
jgi:hypothetical protein